MNTLTIPAFSAEAAEAAQRRLDNLAKVPRSLGRIEELAVRLAGITGKECPAFPEKSVVLFAADHDIALQGVQLLRSKHLIYQSHALMALHHAFRSLRIADRDTAALLSSVLQGK